MRSAGFRVPPLKPRRHPADYDAIFFVGGHGTMWDNPELAKIASDFLELSRAVPGAPIKSLWRDGMPAAAPVPADSGEWVVLRGPDAMGNGEAGR
jgi:hypothetical protein